MIDLNRKFCNMVLNSKFCLGDFSVPPGQIVLDIFVYDQYGYEVLQEHFKNMD